MRYYLIDLIPHIRSVNKTYKLKNIHRNDFAFVFANGPSLQKIDPNKIKTLQNKNYFVFVINSFIDTEFARHVIPDYYLLSDPVYFGVNMHLISEERKKETMQDMKKIKDNNIKLFVPCSYVSLVDYDKKFSFNDSQNLFCDNITNIYRPRGYISMTAYKALAMACFMGFKNIYICGFDNNYFKNLFVNENNEIFYEEDHFYDDDSNKSKIHKTEAKSVGELLYNHHFLFKHLEKFSKYPIINLDKESLVDSFEKKHNLDVYI